MHAPKPQAAPRSVTLHAGLRHSDCSMKDTISAMPQHSMLHSCDIKNNLLAHASAIQCSVPSDCTALCAKASLHHDNHNPQGTWSPGHDGTTRKATVVQKPVARHQYNSVQRLYIQCCSTCRVANTTSKQMPYLQPMLRCRRSAQ
jgi:hypothetical protein